MGEDEERGGTGCKDEFGHFVRVIGSLALLGIGRG